MCESTVTLLVLRGDLSLPASWPLGEIGGSAHIYIVCRKSLDVKDQSSVSRLLSVTCYIVL